MRGWSVFFERSAVLDFFWKIADFFQIVWTEEKGLKSRKEFDIQGVWFFLCRAARVLVPHLFASCPPPKTKWVETIKYFYLSPARRCPPPTLWNFRKNQCWILGQFGVGLPPRIHKGDLCLTRFLPLPSWKRQGVCSAPYARLPVIILKKIIFTISFLYWQSSHFWYC